MKKIISQRRSIFPSQFSGIEISDTQIHELMEAANWAPTHRKTEPWRFKVVRGNKKEALCTFLVETYTKTATKFSKIKCQNITRKIKQSSAVIIICMQRDAKASVPEWEEIAATAMAVQNLWLRATEMGLGGYWSTPAYSNQMNHFIPLNNGEKCLGLFYLGNFEGPPPNREPRNWKEKVTWYG